MTDINDNPRAGQKKGAARQFADVAIALGKLTAGLSKKAFGEVAALFTPDPEDAHSDFVTRHAITQVTHNLARLGGQHEEVVIPTLAELGRNLARNPLEHPPHHTVYPTAVLHAARYFAKYNNLSNYARGVGAMALSTQIDAPLYSGLCTSLCDLAPIIMTKGSPIDALNYFDTVKHVLMHTNPSNNAHHIMSRELPRLRDVAITHGQQDTFTDRLGDEYVSYINWLGYDPVQRDKHIKQDANGRLQP